MIPTDLPAFRKRGKMVEMRHCTTQPSPGCLFLCVGFTSLWAWLILFLVWVSTIQPDTPVSYLGVVSHLYTIIWLMIPCWIVIPNENQWFMYLFWGFMPGSLLALIAQFYLFIRKEHESNLLYSLPIEIGAPIGMAYLVFFVGFGTIYSCRLLCGDDDD
jgi:hypothetical protein